MNILLSERWCYPLWLVLNLKQKGSLLRGHSFISSCLRTPVSLLIWCRLTPYNSSYLKSSGRQFSLNALLSLFLKNYNNQSQFKQVNLQNVKMIKPTEYTYVIWIPLRTGQTKSKLHDDSAARATSRSWRCCCQLHSSSSVYKQVS